MLFMIAAVVLTMVVAGLLGWLRHREKTRRLIAFAQHHRWHYSPADQSLVGRFRGQPFGAGSSRRATHVLHGGYRDAWFTVFEYRYTEKSGEDSTTYRFTVAALDLPASRPRLQVTRETRLARLLDRFGIRDLQLENEQFNDTFHIETDDDRFAYDVLHPRTMEWLLTDPRALTRPFRFDGRHLLTWRRGPIEPNAVLPLLDYVSDIRDRVPSFVWRP